MPKQLLIISSLIILVSAFSFSCQQKNSSTANSDSTKTQCINGGFSNQQDWGKHLVTIGDCSDCHTPKKMGAHGPEDDMSLYLSGHPSQMPIPDIDRKTAETKHLGVTNTQTAWIGPWGISYSANLTSDSTGIGNWKEDQFIKCMREGKYMGLDNTRMLLPPMPWQNIGKMSDDELKAVFAYLKSVKPIHNIVPEAAAPIMAMK